jgi:uncharacterized membrane protein YphA (DoxX/SURF4 family)
MKYIYTCLYLLTLFCISAKQTFAHVAYVVGKNVMRVKSGSDSAYLLTPLGNGSYIAIIIGTLIAVVVGAYILKKTPWGRRWVIGLDEKLRSYHELIPWIIRLSLGIALIGAGTAGVLVSPILTTHTLGGIQILLGFLLMSGFLLTPTILATIGIFIYALTQDFYILGNLDFLALALGFLIFHSARPGIDDVLGISILKKIKINRHFLAPILRFGIGVGMIFLALYEKLLNPHFMELVVNQYNLHSVIPVTTQFWVLSTGLVELAIGICILIGWYTRAVSIIAVIVISLSFFYFKESVYSHITLFGTLSILAIEGSGILSIDTLKNKFKKNGTKN